MIIVQVVHIAHARSLPSALLPTRIVPPPLHAHDSNPDVSECFDLSTPRRSSARPTAMRQHLVQLCSTCCHAEKDRSCINERGGSRTV
jgi:hypothetical protein